MSDENGIRRAELDAYRAETRAARAEAAAFRSEIAAWRAETSTWRSHLEDRFDALDQEVARIARRLFDDE